MDASPSPDSPKRRTKPAPIHEWITVVVAVAAVFVAIQGVSVAHQGNQFQARLTELEEWQSAGQLQLVDVMAVTIGVDGDAQPAQSQVLLRLENRGGHPTAIHAVRIWATYDGFERGMIGTMYDSPVLVFNFTGEDPAWGNAVTRSIDSGEQVQLAYRLPTIVGATQLRIEVEPVIGQVVQIVENPPFEERFRIDLRVPPGTAHYEARMAN